MYLRLIFWIIIILIITFFIIFNVEPRVNIFILPGITLKDMPLALVIIISIILGFISGLLVAFSKIIILQRKIKQLEKESQFQN